MNCEVAICNRVATWIVTFRWGRSHVLCDFHAHDRRDRPRWDLRYLRECRPLRDALPAPERVTIVRDEARNEEVNG